MKTQRELRELYSLAQKLITTTPAGQQPAEAHVMLWMATGFALGNPEHQHLPDDARRILAQRAAKDN